MAWVTPRFQNRDIAMSKLVRTLVTSVSFLGFASCGSIDVERALEDLYEARPSVRAEVERSAGYAVFSIFSIHAGLVSLASGAGEAVDGITGERTPMRLARFGVGPGLAIKGGYLYLIFEDEESFDELVDGRWAVGGLAEASLRLGGIGGSAAVGTSPARRVDTYLRTHTGVALEVVLAGARLWPTDS
jgi:hypothetical protein